MGRNKRQVGLRGGRRTRNCPAGIKLRRAGIPGALPACEYPIRAGQAAQTRVAKTGTPGTIPNAPANVVRGGRRTGECDSRDGELTNAMPTPAASGEKPQGRADGIVPGSRPHTDRPRSHRNVAAVSCGEWQAPDSAASPGNAEGTKAPGEAPVLACPRHRKSDSRASIKRADDPWVIAYRGVRWTVTHENAACDHRPSRRAARLGVGCDPFKERKRRLERNGRVG